MNVRLQIGHRLQKFFSVIFRNRIVLSYLNYFTKRNRVNLHWAPLTKNNKWGLMIKDNSSFQNLGDYLAVPLYEYLLAYFHLNRNKKVTKTKHLYMVGSILLMGYQDATIWGSGVLKTEPDGAIWARKKYRKLDVRCVRGPETERRLVENGYTVPREVYGDPAILLPIFYTPHVTCPKKPYGVIYHMSFEREIENGISIITNEWQRTIDEICSCKLIISSSLHGIIIAEAYGIPAILLNELPLAGDMFKYNDYYFSTGRYVYPICNSVEEALSMPIPSVPDLSKLRENLLESFPLDLWE